ncbi:WD40 repeat-like protein [Schizophyllum commune Loenen D]|nr:WD40 repeat-like protein [Schizophyllum commune Loenen D]
MPSINVGSQIFDLVFHPKEPTIYTALLTGHVKAFGYDAQGALVPSFSLRVSKRSCRGLDLGKGADTGKVYVVGKGKAIHTIDTSIGKVSETRAGAHESAINCVKCLTSWLLSTGDDDGVIKLWDPRQRESTRSYTQHFDYITDFLWLEDKKHLVATSGDGSLSVMDVRAKTLKPIAHSEDQEDELLSIGLIAGGTKAVVGTQMGVLSIFNRSSGWGDCVDRVPGHPQSIDALCTLPDLSDIGVDTTRTVLTGSSDGFVRAVQVLPTKLLGVVADHGEWPVERVAVGQAPTSESHAASSDAKGNGKAKEEYEEEEEGSNSAKYWVGSVGHDESLRLTSLEAFFKEGGVDVEEGEGEAMEGSSEDSDESDEDEDGDRNRETGDDDGDSDDSDSDEEKETKKRKRKQPKDLLAVKKKKGRNEIDLEGKFFDGL